MDLIFDNGFSVFLEPPAPQAPQSAEYDPTQVMATLCETLRKEIAQKKENVKTRIEDAVLNLIDTIVNEQPVFLERPRQVKSLKDRKRLDKNPKLSTKTGFGQSLKGSRKFTMHFYVMGLVYRMLQQKQTSTMRDMYYESMNFFGNQQRLYTAIAEVSLFLKVPREALGIEASAKGLVAGSITFTHQNGNIIRASDAKHGIIVPNKLHEFTIKTDAKFVIFVEKDATFQRLLDERIFEHLGSIVLITGKGYPDTQTRRLLCILSKIYNLTVYALVDCDPYGVEIASVVKWGSFNSSSGNFEDSNVFLRTDLCVPNLVWLGVLPTEVSMLSLPLNASAEFTERDKRKLESVAERIQFNNHEPWLAEVRYLQELGRKTELEALFSSPMFTTQVYLPSKLAAVEGPR